MKKFIYITLTLCFFFQTRIAGQSAGYEAYEHNTFTAKRLSAFELKGFENRAIQKVKDLGDYITLVSDKSYNKEMREQAKQMLIELFANIKAEIKNPDKKIVNSKETRIINYAQFVLTCKYSKIEAKNTEIKLSSPLKLSSKGNFKGMITYNEKFAYFKNNKLVRTQIRKRTIEFLLIKQTKLFGNRIELVWNVYLGDIE